MSQQNEYDDEPELAGYEPHADKPLRSPHLVTVVRVVVIIGLIGLILPGILVAAGTANRTAINTCATYVAFYAPDAVTFSTRFELVSPSGIGWNCYAVAFGGEEILVRALGLIPGGPRLPSVPVENS